MEVDLQKVNDLCATQFFKNEIEILNQVKDKVGFPNMLFHFKEQNKYYIAQELFNEGDLSNKVSILTFNEKLAVGLTVMQAICYLHNQNIMYRDLKLENILVHIEQGKKQNDRKIKVALADFGSCIDLSKQKINELAGSYTTLSPEQLISEGKEGGLMADIWSLGIILVQLFESRMSGRSSRLLQEINTKIRIPIQEACSTTNPMTPCIKIAKNWQDQGDNLLTEPTPQTMDHLIWSMLHVNPQKRPDIQTVCSKYMPLTLMELD